MAKAQMARENTEFSGTKTQEMGASTETLGNTQATVAGARVGIGNISPASAKTEIAEAGQCACAPLTSRMIRLAKILVATDFSPASERAVSYAASLARKYESHLFIAHVLRGDVYPLASPEIGVSIRRQEHSVAEQHLQELIASRKLHGVHFDAIFEEGTLWKMIEAAVKKHDIELIVVGTHGGGALQKVLLGSGAEEIFRHAKRPVLTVGPAAKAADEAMVFKNILFATDFGLGAEREALFAFSLAQEHGAKLTMLHVTTHADDYTAEGLALKKEIIEQQMRELVPVGAEVWCGIEFRTAFGSPTEEILQVAEDCEANLIVMGAKPRIRLVSHYPRTTAYRVVCGAKCPVLTVRS